MKIEGQSEIEQVSKMFGNKSEGRIVINEEGCAHLGLLSKNSTIEKNTVYELFINPFGQCRITSLGKSSFDNEHWELGSLLLTQTDALITTVKEKETNRMKETKIARMVALSNGVIVLVLNKSNDFLEYETVYDISTNGYLGTSLVSLGETSVFKNNSRLNINTLLLTEKEKFILSDRERKLYQKELAKIEVNR